jgi:predicted Zn-dependent protease
VLLLGMGCAFRPIESTPFIGAELSIEKEIEMTADIHRQVRAQVEFLSDPVLLGYLNEIGQRIVRTTEPQPFVYRFSLLKADELNAFTIGGGYVYISSEVLAQAGDVSELASVLAHEIAHVRQRHIAKRQENQGLATLTSLAAIAAVLAGGDPELIAAAQGINVALELKNSRANEAESDREAIGYLVRAGYDPIGMMHFFQRILAEKSNAGSTIPPYLYSHPGIKERIAASRVAIKRTKLPPNLVRVDPRLAQMQARLALVLSPVAGGSGLQARAAFDRGVADPYLAKAESQKKQGNLAKADSLLAQAQELEANDPRVALARADVAELRGDLEAARIHLERAFEIDSSVPLVQYRLGRIHKQLGNRSRAVFYLEQAVTNFKPGTKGRRRAELEIEQLGFPVFEASGLGVQWSDQGQTRFVRGERIRWWGRISRRIQTYNPKIRVTWADPKGRIVQDSSLRMGLRGQVSSTLETKGLPLGRWTVKVSMGDSLLEEHSFQLVDESKSPPAPLPPT